jgi:hypothetical protein
LSFGWGKIVFFCDIQRKKTDVCQQFGRPDIAFFPWSSTAVVDDIMLRRNAIILDNKRHYPEEQTPSS